MTILALMGIFMVFFGFLLSFKKEAYDVSSGLVFAICVIGWVLATLGLFWKKKLRGQK